MREIKGKFCPIAECRVRCMGDACAAFRRMKKATDPEKFDEYCAMMPSGELIDSALGSIDSAIDDLRTSLIQTAEEQNERLIRELRDLGTALENSSTSLENINSAIRTS